MSAETVPYLSKRGTLGDVKLGGRGKSQAQVGKSGGWHLDALALGPDARAIALSCACESWRTEPSAKRISQQDQASGTRKPVPCALSQQLSFREAF